MRLQLQVYVQFISAHQATGRVHQNVVAHGVTLGIQALQNTKRAVMHMACNTMTFFYAVINVECGFPAHGFIQKA
jgi:hypothetical protein